MQTHLLGALLSFLTTLTLAADITFTLPPSPHFPHYNPSALPSTTQATIFRHGTTLHVPLTRRNTFEFHNVTQGSYLFTVQCRDYAFGPLRVDVLPVNDDTQQTAPVKEKVEVFQTFWGNEWGNKGESRGGGVVEVPRTADAGLSDGGEAVVVQVMPEKTKEFYTVRMGFSPLQFFKNPMILMGLLSLALIVVIPWITDNMDEETRAEFEEMQRKSPISQATSGAAMQNFDLASWMAGRSTAASTAKDSSSEQK